MEFILNFIFIKKNSQLDTNRHLTNSLHFKTNQTQIMYYRKKAQKNLVIVGDVFEI